MQVIFLFVPLQRSNKSWHKIQLSSFLFTI
nr:MAG TPA: hypothetical protein [Siphoviridae sp. ctweK11]